MIFTSPNAALQLKTTQTLGIRGAQGALVFCSQGIVWITQEGDSRDIFLRPGDDWVIEQNGLVLIQALEDAAIKISSHAMRVKPEAVPVSILPLKRLRAFYERLSQTGHNRYTHARHGKQV